MSNNLENSNSKNTPNEITDNAITRKDFILGNAALLALTALTLSSGRNANKLFGQTTYPDLVAVRGDDPSKLVDASLSKLGGMGMFVKRGQTVLVKPNIGWDVPPELAANTNPLIVKRIVELCFQAGAKSVTVFDHTCDIATRSYQKSGIEDAVKSAGGTVVHATSQNSYRNVSIPKGIAIKNALVNTLYLDSDVVINVPVLKHHSGARLTMALKNLMGVVWDRGSYHRNGLQQAIADLPTLRKPTLNFLDAYRVMTRNGPRGTGASDVVLNKTLLCSTDIVAIDTAGALIVNRKAADIQHITLAEKHGLGTTNLESIRIERITL